MSQSFDTELRQTFDALVDRIRADVAAHLAGAAGRLSDEAQAALQAGANAAARDAAASAERAATDRLTAYFTEREASLRRDLAASQAGLPRLLDDFRTIDDTTSLSQALDALITAAGHGAARTALFLVRGDILRAWSQSGFAVLGSALPFEVPMDEAGLLGEAVRSGSARYAGAGQPDWPAFAVSPDAAALVAAPLSMSGEVVAVLCGVPSGSAPEQGRELATRFEALTRHASRVLEALTALRLAQASMPPMSMSRPMPRG